MALPSHVAPRLEDELPELAAYVRAGLQQRARNDLINDIETARVYGVGVQGKHASLDLVPDLDLAAMMANPRRERIWIGAPRGVRGRSWAISLDVIDGKTWLLAVSHPSILREPLQRLSRRLSGPLSSDLARR